MKSFLGVLLLGFALAFTSLGASTNQPPTTPEQMRRVLEAAQKTVSKGLDQTFDASYETVTNKLSALKPSPAASGFSFPGCEFTPGQIYELDVPEEPIGDISGKDTIFLITRIDANHTRVQMKTIKYGLFFNGRDRQIEKQRMHELSQLLSTQN